MENQTPGGNISAPSDHTARLGGLDGLRAISILFVVAFHLGWRIKPGQSTYYIRDLALRAPWGVHVFFVISGFLITWLLVSERDRRGKIDLKRFYERRFFRILPPAFAYLLVVLILGMVGIVAVSWKDVGKAAFFIRNIANRGADETVHFWSLSIEEQFYLFWPLFMVLLRKNWQIPITAILVLIAPFWTWINYRIAANPEHINMWRTDLNYSLLLIGCLVALGRSDARYSSLLRNGRLQYRMTPNLLIFGALAAAFFPARLSGPFVLALRPWLFSICIALIINFVIEGHHHWLNRLLDFKPLVAIGRISYSLYLWQQLFCFGDPGDHWMRRFPQCVILTFATAMLSFWCVELPSARLRDYFKSMRAPAPKLATA